MSTFKFGDRVKITPTTRRGWNSTGRMEASIGRVGEIVGVGHMYEVQFKSTSCDTEGARDYWEYYPEDFVKHTEFKGNKP